MLNKRLVLASNSPRRIALLKLLGYYFEVIPHEIDECIYSDVSPTELVQNLAFLKANDVARKVENAIVIGADTIVLHDMCVLGKPKDTIDARRILSKLCNSEHDIISGVCIIDVPSKKKLLRIERTHIKMKNISEKEIEKYVSTGEPIDKAGAYAIQGEGGKFIEKIDGSYSNVVGLPLEAVQEMLNKLIKDTNA